MDLHELAMWRCGRSLGLCYYHLQLGWSEVEAKLYTFHSRLACFFLGLSSCTDGYVDVETLIGQFDPYDGCPTRLKMTESQTRNQHMRSIRHGPNLETGWDGGPSLSDEYGTKISIWHQLQICKAVLVEEHGRWRHITFLHMLSCDLWGSMYARPTDFNFAFLAISVSWRMLRKARVLEIDNFTRAWSNRSVTSSQTYCPVTATGQHCKCAEMVVPLKTGWDLGSFTAWWAPTNSLVLYLCLLSIYIIIHQPWALAVR